MARGSVKPSLLHARARRVPRAGAFPLSFTLDSVGPLANSIGCCAAYDAVLAGETRFDLAPLEAKGLRLLLPRSSALEELDTEVSRAFERSLSVLSRAGALISERPVPQFDRQGEYFKGGGYAGAEAYHLHRAYEARIGEYDPRVGKRILLGKSMSASDYLTLGDLRAGFISDMEALCAGFDAIVMPTVPCIAPTIADTDASDEDYFRWNMRILRNNGLINFLDGCAASLPCQEPGAAPVGLMVCGLAGTDRHTLAVAAAIERALARD